MRRSSTRSTARTVPTLRAGFQSIRLRSSSNTSCGIHENPRAYFPGKPECAPDIIAGMTALLFIAALGLLPLGAAIVAIVLMFKHELHDT